LISAAVAAVLLGSGRFVEQPGDDQTWWSETPLARPAVPEVNDESWPANPIDHFILARLEANGLEPNPRASKAELIRRASYDLIGLPPTPEEVRAFVEDENPGAWENLIDRLLASPHYGEKWGRHWLDLVRFAETDSYERDRLKPNAWKYRDYVIESFNADKPYDRFIIEQLAGDELGEKTTLDSIIATGYYRLGIWDDEPADPLQAQYDDLDSILATTSQVMLGMSLNCARCHDHKGDPIPQKDYYRFLAFFENIKPYREINRGNEPTYENVLRNVDVNLGASEYEENLESYEDRRESLLKSIAEVRERVTTSRKMNDSRQGPILHLSFDDQTTLAVSREGLEIEGNPESIEGKHGRALRFNRRDALKLPRPVQDDLTMAFWFNTTETGPGGNDYRWFLGAGLMDGEVPGIVDDFGVSYHSDGRITAGTGRPETFIHSPGGYNDGAWHHVAFTRSQESGEIALYLDGERVASATGSTNPLNTPDFITIGRIQAGGRHFRGAMDDVRFYDRVLDQRAILDLVYDSGFSEGFVAFVLAEFGEEEHRRYGELIDELISLKRPVRAQTEVLCVQDRGASPPESFVRIRGNAVAKGDPVQAGYPALLTSETASYLEPPDDSVSSYRRRTLAEWIASPDNDRTARVMANRLWQFHFGRGLCPTPNDFGRLGLPPTHPMLLDWLASELIEQDWSLKRMHKLIMTSSAYRMSSRGQAEALADDPQNNLLWRFDMRRLTAEEIRDSILVINGTLNPEMGGPGVYPPMPKEALATSSRPDEAWGKSSPEDATRRSVYIHVKRSLIYPMLESFDLADTDFTCPVRFTTTQPTQALTMINSEFTNEQAHVFADRLREDSGDDLRAQVERAIELATQRDALDDEIKEGLRLIESLRADGFSERESLDYFCLIVLNLNEFVYLD